MSVADTPLLIVCFVVGFLLGMIFAAMTIFFIDDRRMKRATGARP